MNCPVIGMVDIELGWTDISTGPNVDPQACYEEIVAIVEAINLIPLIADALRPLDRLILTPEQRRLIGIIDRLTGQDVKP
jgi:hypothetical protein